MSSLVSNGPTTASIFVGHLISSSALDDRIRDPSLSSDLALKAAYIIEGLHVVPNKISPPDFDIEGRTIPDIHTRPFNLMISARNVDNPKDLVLILTLTITGGCQWIPILPPFNSIAIDHLRFHGDFEIVTVIVHGIKLDTQMLSSAAQNVLQSPYDDSSLTKKPGDSDSLNEISEGGNKANIDGNATGESVSTVIPREILSALHSNVEIYSTMISVMDKRTSWGSSDSIIQVIASADASKSSCIVAVEVVAELVGAIFSIEDDNTLSDPEFAVRIKAINNLVKIMNQCWKSATDDEVKNVSTHEQFSVALGEEAVCVLAGIAFNLLKCLRADNLEICTTSREQYDPAAPDEFRELCKAVLNCCSSLMMNEFSAKAFADVGGLSLMSCIARQSPQLPPRLQAQLISCFSTALKHSELLPKLIEPPNVYTDESGSYTTDVSVYQTLVLAMGNMKESAPAVRYCKEALQWSALADSLSALCVFAEGLPSALAIIAEAVSHRVATTHKMPAGAERDEEERMDEEEEEGDRDDDSGKSTDCGMTKACALVHDLALQGDTLVRAMLCALGMSTSLERVSTSSSQGEPNKCFRLSLYELLQSSGIIPSLAALVALSQAAGDLSSLCEWSTPQRDHMAADADTCTLMVVSTSAALLALNDGVGLILLSANHSAVQLIWQYLSQEDSAMTCQSMAELHLASQSSNSPNGFVSIHPSSVGWILYLSGHATALANTLISAYTSLEALSCSSDFDNSPSKRRPQGGDEKLVLQEQLRLFDAVETLNASSYSPAGCSVVVAVISQFCIQELIEVARVGTHSASGSASSVVSSAARLLFLCALSGDKRALDSLSKASLSQKIFDLAGVVVQSAPLSLSALEMSVSAAAQLKQSSKTVDPRHRTAKVDVPRGYTDDVRALAAEVTQQSLPSPPKVVVAIEGALTINTDGDVGRSASTDTVSKHKSVVVHFISIEKSIHSNKVAGEEQAELSHGSHWSCLPALSLSVRCLHASMTSPSHLSSALHLNDEMPVASPASEIAHDGSLQHDLTVTCEILNSMLEASEISAIRYGVACPVTLNALILADVVKCSQNGTKLFTTNDSYSNRQVPPPVSDGTADISSAAEGAMCKLSAVVRDADMCLQALKAVLGLLLEVLRAAVADSGVGHKHGSDTVASNRILNAVMDSRAAALAIVGEDKAGTLGSSVREICALSAGIFSLHCPKLMEQEAPLEGSDLIPVDVVTDEGSKNISISGLIAQIAQRSIYVPSTLLSNMSLLVELLPAAHSSYHYVDDSVSVYNTANTLNMDVTGAGKSGKQDRKRQSDLREKQIERSEAIFELWEAFCLHRYADSAATEEDVEKKKEEDLFRGSGSMVLPDDPLVSDLNPAKGPCNSRIGLRSLILFALASSSREVHRLASVLCVKSMCLGALSAVDVSSAIVHTIQRRVALHLTFSGEADEPQTFAPELSLCRLLLLIESLCRTDTLCVALVQEGLLLPALQGVRGGTDRNVCILAMQLLTTIHRTLLRITSGQPPQDDASNASNVAKSQSIKRKLLWVTHALTDALVGALPLALVSFQDSPQGVLLWQQAVLTMSLLPSCCVKRIVETISSTLTLEGLAVKLWLAFEDSYQQLFEVTELIKLCQAHPEEASLQDLAGQDCGQGALRSAHILYTGAACALRAVIDIALMSFLEGTIALPTLARACRTSLSDPKRVVLRYQRAYTMWAVQARQTASNSAGNGIGADGGKSARRSTVFTPFASGSISDPQCSNSFDSRHELISAALRSAVESTGRVSRLVAGREIRPKGGNGIIKCIDLEPATAISTEFDFYRPFCELGEAEGDMLRLWFACTPPSIRLAGLSDVHTGGAEDTLHTVLRRGLLDGDDTEACIYNSSVFVHLGASKVALTNRGKRKWVSAAIESNEKHQVPEAPRHLPLPLPLMPIFNPSLSLLRTAVPLPVPGSAPHTRQFLSTLGPPPPPPPLFMPPNQNQQHRQHLMGRMQPPPEFNIPHQASLPPPPLPPRMQMRPDTQFPPPPNLQQQQQQQQQAPNQNQNQNQNQRW